MTTRQLPFSITTDAYDVNSDIEPRLDVFSQAGFRYIHWCEHWVSAHLYSAQETARTKTLLRRYDISCTDIHGVCGVEEGEAFSLQRWIELNVNRMEFVKELGGDVNVLHLPLKPFVGKRSQLDAAKEMLDSLLPHAEACGAQLAVENGNADLISQLFETYPYEDVAFCYDSGHSNIAGDLDQLEAFADRLIVVHLHDNHGEKDEHDLPGTGTIDWRRVMRFVLNTPHARTLNMEISQRNRADEDHRTWAGDAYSRLADLAGYAG